MKPLHFNILNFFIVILIQNVNSYLRLYSKVNKIIPPKVPRLASFVGPKLAELDQKLSRCGRNQIDIRELTISQIQIYFKSNQLTSLELTLCYLERIRGMNPYLKAVIEINKQAANISAKKDLERTFGINRNSPLHGIPILLKDNMETVNDMQTTAGAAAIEFVMPKREGELVKKLRRAGAVIIGKTNPTEWAGFRDPQAPSGWSSRGGQTRSAYVLSSDPSGSSTGSAVGVSANLATIALGTETDGSIIEPSNCASLVGLKTTVGAVSTDRVIPLSFSQDTVGPMARSVTDAAILLKMIYSGRGGLKEPGYNVEEWFKQKHFKVGVIRTTFWNASDPTIIKYIPKLEKALEALRNTGKVTVIDQIPNRLEDKLFKSVSSEDEYTVLLHEFKYGVNKYLEKQSIHLELIKGRRIKSLADIIRFNKMNPPREGYGQKNLIAAQATDGISNKTYRAVRDNNKKAAEEYINTVLSRDNLDVIAGPCDTSDTVPMFSIGAIAGYPSITVPVGATEDGIPFGICFLGRAHSEQILLKLAFILEQARPSRKMPRFRN